MTGRLCRGEHGCGYRLNWLKEHGLLSIRADDGSDEVWGLDVREKDLPWLGELLGLFRELEARVKRQIEDDDRAGVNRRIGIFLRDGGQVLKMQRQRE
jgi:hypothetical protein